MVKFLPLPYNRTMDNNAGTETDKSIKQRVNLSGLVVRPITPDEEREWDTLMDLHHYLGFRTLTGRRLKYVALLENRWVALIGWGSSALKCTPRDRWIGWPNERDYDRLQYIANNQRFLVLPGVSIKNLASKVLALNVKRLSMDWENVYGHPILVVETFVDHSRYKGTCYLAAGWLPLGETTGYGRTGGKYYHHGQTKTVLVKPLIKGAAEILAAEFLSPELKGENNIIIDMNKVNIDKKDGLLEHMALIADQREKRGIRHPQVTILTIAVAAILSGSKSFVAIGEWAANLQQDMLKRFGVRYNLRLGKRIPPSEKTLRNTLKRVDGDEADFVIGRWLSLQTKADDKAVAVDGKTLRGSTRVDGKRTHLVAAFLHHEKVVINQQQVDDKSNEITTFIPLLEPLDIKDRVVTADAMHTQTNNARFLVEEKEADYIFPVKQNQGTLFNTISRINEDSFSPSVSDKREGSRED